MAILALILFTSRLLTLLFQWIVLSCAPLFIMPLSLPFEKPHGKKPQAICNMPSSTKDVASKIQLCSGLCQDLDRVLQDFIMESFSRFQKIDCRMELVEEKLDILATWFT